MRVAIVSESFLPQVNGVTNSVLRIIEHLERTGHDALVVAPGSGPGSHGATPVVRTPAVPLPVYRSFAVGLPTRVVGDAFRDFRPDIVHLASPAVLGVAGAVEARRRGLPTVAVFQSDLAGFAGRYKLGAFSPAIWRWLRWVHSHADLTLAPSSSTVWELDQHGIGPVARWGRGVDLEQFAPRHRDDTLRRELAPAGEMIVGYVGRLAAEKQVHHLACLATLRGCRLVIVGDGPARRSLERRLPRARFLGFRSGLDLARLVASFDVFVHPGANETFCQAIQEALAAAVPVIASAAGGPLDLVRHGDNGYLVPAGRPEMLRAAVASLRDDPLRREAMSRSARNGVLSRTWPAVVDELLAHYDAILGAHRAEVRAA